MLRASVRIHVYVGFQSSSYSQGPQNKTQIGEGGCRGGEWELSQEGSGYKQRGPGAYSSKKF